MSDLAKWIGANTHYVHSYISGAQSVKTESTRTLSDFNFQWTKTLYQNNLNHITFFLTFFKGQRCNKSSVVTPKKTFLWEPEKINVKFHKITSYT